jgi:DNA-binding transcriptional LysR family regulator
MASIPRISLEQWRALMSVVDAGGYAQAALALHKSQSAVTYAVQKLESVLGVKAFEIQGRKAVLTRTGELLVRRARTLVEQANDIERAAKRMSAGWEADIRVAVEVIFPTWLVLSCLDRFGRESPHTRIELIESVLGGTPEALLQGRADIAITPQIPPGFLGDPLLRVRFVAVAHPEHALHRLNRALAPRDLRLHRHLTVRDSGIKRDSRAVSLDADQCWTVSELATSIKAARMGFGFAWFPEEQIREELANGTLKPLPLREGRERFAQLYLVFAEPEDAGPGMLRLAQLLREAVTAECPRQDTSEAAPVPGARRANAAGGRKKPRTGR